MERTFYSVVAYFKTGQVWRESYFTSEAQARVMFDNYIDEATRRVDDGNKAMEGTRVVLIATPVDYDRPQLLGTVDAEPAFA